MELRRELINRLTAWKDKPGRKPLMLHGARQVGKTWLMKRFGEECFEDTAYFNFDEHNELRSLFTDKNPQRIVRELSYMHGRAIKPETTLIVFDEIQECNEALNSVKYFCEQMPEQAVVCAGSLLGVSLTANSSFPVGKVDHLKLYPLTFAEYLHEADNPMYQYLTELDGVKPLPQVFFDRVMSQFRAYMLCGGMPAAAVKMMESNSLDEVEQIQQGILNDYIFDFTKHTSPMLAARIGHVWKSVPSQLARENRKFLYQLVRPGARAREYEDAILWLERAGLAARVMLNKKPGLPMSAYDDLSAFKIYLSDIGLLRSLAKLPAAAILADSSLYTEFKGAFMENHILCSLSAQFDVPLRYWTSNREAEVDFVLQYEGNVIPIEVKSGFNTRSRSLMVYNNTYQPKICLRYSAQNLQLAGNVLNMPFFMADFTQRLLKNSLS